MYALTDSGRQETRVLLTAPGALDVGPRQCGRRRELVGRQSATEFDRRAPRAPSPTVGRWFESAAGGRGAHARHARPQLARVKHYTPVDHPLATPDRPTPTSAQGCRNSRHEVPHLRLARARSGSLPRRRDRPGRRRQHPRTGGPSRHPAVGRRPRRAGCKTARSLSRRSPSRLPLCCGTDAH